MLPSALTPTLASNQLTNVTVRYAVNESLQLLLRIQLLETVATDHLWRPAIVSRGELASGRQVCKFGTSVHIDPFAYAPSPTRFFGTPQCACARSCW